MNNNINSDEILEYLRQRNNVSLDEFNKFERELSIKEVIKALNTTTDEVEVNILCHIVGSRKSIRAVDTLILLLRNQSTVISSDAADALAKIGNIKAGPSLLEQFITRPNYYYAVGLGALKYRPAIPYLIRELRNRDVHTRGACAWSLGEMKAKEALMNLKTELSMEIEPYCIDRMKQAIELIEE